MNKHKGELLAPQKPAIGKHDLAYRVFGRLQAVSVAGSLRQGRRIERLWNCKCACGSWTTATANKLTSGHTRSCGCLARESAAALLRAKATHGMTDTKEFKVWFGMLRRCQDQKMPGYQNYGGRGIRVCERWQKFENFYADMGKVPNGKTLDRINNDGNYEPGNCRWATPMEQYRNTRPRKRDWHGRLLPIGDA